MEFQVKTCSLDAVRTDCLIVQVYADKTLSNAATTLDKITGGAVSKLIEQEDLTLKPGELAWLSTAKDATFKRALAICIGASPKKITLQDAKTSADQVAKALKNKALKQAAWSIENNSDIADQDLSTVIAQSFGYQLYAYNTTKTQNIKVPSLKKLVLHSEEKLESTWKTGLNQGGAIAEGVNLARELGNLPGNVCTPSYLAEQAEKLGEDDKLKVKVLDEKQMKKLGMGSLLSVAAGSEQPPRLVMMEYNGGAKNDAPTVLVGKGVTFDTGGISLKPGAGMDEMKFDMCGAASVFGVMKTLLTLKPKVNVIGVVAAAENMPNGRATKPGDVVTSMSGQTIEVLNTDAEGRLILCDALTYVERFKPATVIDIATLTGACVIALGNHASGLYANDQALADELLAAGDQVQDRAWQMPLWDDYQKSLDSNFADIANIGGREGGSITAACFLSRFTKSYKWAHLDIAGTAWHSGKAKGATGRPVGLLLQYLLKLYQ